MMIELKKEDVGRWLRRIDWPLLLFLLLFLNVKLVVKAIAILVIYIMRPNFKFGFSFRKDSRLPLFYVLITGIAVLNWILSGNFSDLNYHVAVVTGISFWAACILAIHQVKLSVEKSSVQIIHNTIIFFLVLNIVCSSINLALIVFETGAINPYIYQGMHQKYFIGTGDNIKGISFDNSTTNALINAFGVIYSLKRSKFFITLACMAILVLTASNLTNLLLVATLIIMFIFKTDRNQKSIIVVCCLFIIIFLSRVSPQNGTYLVKSLRKKFPNAIPAPPPPYRVIVSVLEKPDSVLTEDEKKQKFATLYLDSVAAVTAVIPKKETVKEEISVKVPAVKPSIPKDNIHTEPFQKNKDTTELQKKLIEFAEVELASFDTSVRSVKRRAESGKVAAMRQTVNFLQQHPGKILTGTGMGKFSSKLAFRISCLGIAGGYPRRFAYIDEDFKNNHLHLYLDYFSKEKELHSFANTPNSVYDQLIAEYGIAGLLSFAFFYLLFFVRHVGKLTYGLPLILVLSGAFATEYWFEQLSIVILFELLLFLNIKETKELSAHE